MKITIYINTDSQAHADSLVYELQRNMSQVTQGVIGYSIPHDCPLFDTNGNTVGYYTVEDLEITLPTKE